MNASIPSVQEQFKYSTLHRLKINALVLLPKILFVIGIFMTAYFIFQLQHKTKDVYGKSEIFSTKGHYVETTDILRYHVEPRKMIRYNMVKAHNMLQRAWRNPRIRTHMMPYSEIKNTHLIEWDVADTIPTVTFLSEKIESKIKPGYDRIRGIKFTPSFIESILKGWGAESITRKEMQTTGL